MILYLLNWRAIKHEEAFIMHKNRHFPRALSWERWRRRIICCCCPFFAIENSSKN